MPLTGCSMALDRSEAASRDTGINASQVAANFSQASGVNEVSALARHSSALVRYWSDLAIIKRIKSMETKLLELGIYAPRRDTLRFR